MSYEYFDPGSTVLGNTWIPTKNGDVFFREDNRTTWDWAMRLAPQQVAEHSLDNNNPMRVLDAGCSRARQTWALAALLATKGIHFLLDAADVNPDVLAKAKAYEPYEGTLNNIKKSLEEQNLPLGCLDYFEAEGKTHVRPVVDLRQYVEFSNMDFRAQSFPPDTHHTTILNNVLGHYHWDERERRTGVTIALNAARSLVPRGILSLNSLRYGVPREFAWQGLTPDPGDLPQDPDFITYNFRRIPLTRVQRIKYGLQKLRYA